MLTGNAEYPPARRCCILGLGNPGKTYARNLHNAGFMVADRYSLRIGAPPFERYPQYEYTETNNEGNRIAVCKPMLYMNRSGDAVLSLISRHGWEPDQFLIVYDDVSIPFGTIRLRGKGSSGGHNGLQSIIDSVGHSDIPRLRFGVGPVDASMDLADFVLSDFSGEQQSVLNAGIEYSCDAVAHYLLNGMERAMNVFNGQIPTSQE